MWATTPPSHDRYMNHPLMFLCRARVVSLSRRSVWIALIVALTLVALAALLDGGEPGPTGRSSTTDQVVTAVSATTVPPSDCGPVGTDCRS
jgi:hypothetical protein